MNTEFHSGSPAETESFAKELAAKGSFGKGSVIGLVGGIGSGKTTFVRGFVAGLGLDSLVTSPTFTIINEYTGDGVRVLHADLYRLSGQREVAELGIEDQIAASDLTFIEWPENAGDFPVPWTARIVFSLPGTENERKIEICIEQ